MRADSRSSSGHFLYTRTERVLIKKREDNITIIASGAAEELEETVDTVIIY